MDDHYITLPSANVAHIIEYEVGVVRCPPAVEGQVRVGEVFRSYVRALNPDSALLLTRVRIPNELLDTCYFNVRPWTATAENEALKTSLGVDTLPARMAVAGGEPLPVESAQTEMIATTLERLRDHCAASFMSFDSEVSFTAHAAARVREIDVRSWLLQNAFAEATPTPMDGALLAGTFTFEGAVKLPCGCMGYVEQAPDHVWVKEVVAYCDDHPAHWYRGRRLPLDYLQRQVDTDRALALSRELRDVLTGAPPPITLPFTLRIDQTGMLLELSMNGRLVGLIQQLELRAWGEGADGQTSGAITFVRYTGMPQAVIDAQETLRALPWLTVKTQKLLGG